MHRRELIRKSTFLLGGLAAAPPHRASAAAGPEKLRLAVMGVNGRGRDLAVGFAQTGGAEITYLCDPDERAIATAATALAKHQASPARGLADFRKALEDPQLDALVIAAPDHWHAPATILACQAGKHVYVEKPASHNAREGDWMVQAARKHNRVVSLGTQRRSMPGVVEAIQKVRGGAIGRVLFSRGWYNNTRPSIGKGKSAPVPSWLDWSLWQGPAPERDFRDNVVHYNWHWFWHWGTGELGNNGIHALDVCRWGLGVDYPVRVTSAGLKQRWDDDQETPDSHTVSFEFADNRYLTWEGRSWSRRGFEGSMFGAAFYGEKGSLILDGANWKQYDERDREVASGQGSASDQPHLKNFLECVRSGARPNADIEEGHRSTLLCHLGNIAWRTRSVLEIDPQTGRIRDNRQAQELWGREYRKGWAPRV